MRWSVFILLVLLVACSKPGVVKTGSSELYTCDDGRIVPDKARCEQTEPEVSMPTDKEYEPEEVPLADTEIDVLSEDDAIEAFEKFAEGSEHNYKFTSIEKRDDGTYRIKYSHDRLGGGNGYVIVDKNGKISEEIGAI